MKAKVFYLLVSLLIFLIGSCTKGEPDENTECNCEKQRKEPETQAIYNRE